MSAAAPAEIGSPELAEPSTSDLAPSAPLATEQLSDPDLARPSASPAEDALARLEAAPELGSYRDALKPATAQLEQLGYSRGVALELAQTAQGLGISPQHFGVLANRLATLTKGEMPTPEQAVELEAQHVEAEYRNTIENLRETLGARFDHVLGSAQALGARVFGEHLDEIANIALADGSALGNHPSFVRALADAAHRVAAVQASGAVPAGMEMSMDPTVAAQKALEFQYEHQQELQDGSHPLHEIRLAQLMGLRALASAPPLPVRLPSGARAPAAVRDPRGRWALPQPEPTPQRVTEEDLRRFQSANMAALTDAFDPAHDRVLAERRRLLEQIREQAA